MPGSSGLPCDGKAQAELDAKLRVLVLLMLEASAARRLGVAVVRRKDMLAVLDLRWCCGQERRCEPLTLLEDLTASRKGSSVKSWYDVRGEEKGGEVNVE